MTSILEDCVGLVVILGSIDGHVTLKGLDSDERVHDSYYSYRVHGTTGLGSERELGRQRERLGFWKEAAHVDTIG